MGVFADTSGAYGITANANIAKGNSDGESTNHSNSYVTANNININSGGDTNIIGAVVTADKVTANIGGDLTMESPQDTAKFDNDQKNAGIGLDIPIGGTGSLSINGGKTDINANYKAVAEQTVIAAGDGGFNINVEGKANFIGAAVTTTEKAIANGRNQFTSKGGITTTDLINTSEYEGEAISAGISIGKGKKVSSNGMAQAELGLGVAAVNECCLMML